LATIRPEEDARGFFFRIDGQPAIMLSISRLPGADAIKTSAAVRAALAEMEPRLPAGVRVSVRSDESEDLADELRDLLLRGAIAFAAVILVIAVMLRDTRAVALVMGSAAIAIAGTALGLYIFKIPANMLTLAGLAMGIGILVQNGLVVAERLGTVPDTRAARADAAARITPAVIGATLTTAVVLFPFLYLQGDARAAFVPFAAAFSMALGWSVLSSVVMIPALARGHRIHEAAWPRMRRLYTRILIRLLRWRWATLSLTVLALAGLTWVFVKKVPRFTFSGFGFGQRTTVDVRLNFPRGSDPVTLDASMREMERMAVGRSGVEMVQTQSFGSSGAFMQVTFSKASEFSALPLEMEERLTQRAVLIGGASVSVRGQGPGFASGMGSVGMATFRVRVLGYSFSGVERLAMDLQERLERIPRVRDVDISTTSFAFGREKAYAITIEPDRPALARYGLTSRDLAAAVAREVSSPGSERIEIAGEEIPITVKAQGARERSLEELRAAMVPTPTGGSVPISAVSAVDEREALSAISREDQQYVRIVAYEFRGPNKLAQRTHNAFMTSVSTPAGYKVEDAGYGFYEPDRSEQGLWLVFAIGVILVILSVALVFDSTWATSIVFLSLPIALGGVILAFWVAKAAFTREAAVGVILVVGHAVNQAILVMDAALAKRHRTLGGAGRGLNAAQALRAARDRAGMIVLVTLSTLASLLPLALGTQTNNLFGAIALAAAGGMIAGTFGALFVVPAMIVGRRGRRSEVGSRTQLQASTAT
jgi:HAE1 family hydrophobic/amphiphilic exporter-1